MAGTSFLTREGPSPHTFAVLSQKHKIYASTGQGASQPIGAISSFNQTQSRNIEPLRGIGFGDVIAELVPGVSDPVRITIDRAALQTSWLMSVFGYYAQANPPGLVRALAHHRWPFDIKSEVLLSQPAVDSGVSPTVAAGCTQAIITFYEGCWMSSYSINFTVDGAIVTENCEVVVTQVTDGRKAPGPCTETGGGSVIYM